MKNEQNARFLRDICLKNTFFPEFWGQFPALKLSVSGLVPNTNYVIMVGIVLWAQSCYICLCAALHYFTALA